MDFGVFGFAAACATLALLALCVARAQLRAIGLYSHIRSNHLKSALLMAGFCVLLGGVWYALCLMATAAQFLALNGLSDTPNLDLVVLQVARGAVAPALATWWVPIILGAVWTWMASYYAEVLIRLGTRARPLERKKNFELYNLVENLAIAAGLPMPRIEIVETPALNAYAAGLTPETSCIGVTRGLLQRLNRNELEAVLAHEITHTKNRDVQLTVIAGIIAGGLSFLADIGRRLLAPESSPTTRVNDMNADTFETLTDSSGGAAGAPAGSGVVVLMVTVAAAAASVIVSFMLLGLVRLFALLTQFAISRSREFLADAGAVELTQNPDALISALRKIEGRADMPWVPLLLKPMMIGTTGYDGWWDELHCTHPSIDARIARLVQFAGGRESAPQSALRAAVGFEHEIGVTPTAGSVGVAPAARGFGRRRLIRTRKAA